MAGSCRPLTKVNIVLCLTEVALQSQFFFIIHMQNPLFFAISRQKYAILANIHTQCNINQLYYEFKACKLSRPSFT
jgi:hypothetical protein